MKGSSQSFTVYSAEELESVAQTFLETFPSGGHFGLHGSMGAGKTTFIHSVCRQLGLSFQGSPTFSLVNEYTLNNGNKLFHFDLYRLSNAQELAAIGFEDYLESGYLIFIEWPQLAEMMNVPLQRISISDNAEYRIIEF